jgi:hypothetical protein
MREATLEELQKHLCEKNDINVYDKHFLYIDNMFFSNPYHSTQYSYILRNGKEEDIIKHRLIIAEFIDSYIGLFNKTNERRNYIVNKMKRLKDNL